MGSEMSSSADVSLQVRRMLCTSGGSMELGQLGISLSLSPQQVEQLVQVEEGRSLKVIVWDKKRVAVSCCELRVCNERSKKCAGDCGKLHLCRYYVLGSCSRTPCKFNHEIQMDPNLRVLQEYKLESLNMQELRLLLLQNDPSLLPEVCIHYNRGDGPYGSCTFKTKCNKLHICQHFLHGDCKFEGQCKRSHNLRDGETLKKLLKWGLSESLVPQLVGIYINANLLYSTVPPSSPSKEIAAPVKNKKTPSAKPSTPQQIDEICLYFIHKSCSFKERCVRHHYHLPYIWQLNLNDKWINIENMEAVEQEYCDPNIRNVTTPLKFDTMTYKGQKIRRLSTPSSASKPPHFILTTDWLWYWKDEFSRWIEYGKENDHHKSSSLNSKDLENIYQSNDVSSVEFKAGTQNYVLSFKDMVQRNVRYGTERKVCRRPKFVSAKDVEQKKSRKSDKSNQDNKSIHPFWDKEQIPDVGYKLVPVSQSSEEYKKIDAMFHRTLHSASIQSISRIQNPALWEVYQWQKEQMKKQNGGKEVDERQLFHGTSDKLIDAICQQNFDWRICGTHGTSYGKGSYFARDASYSHNYSHCTISRTQIMFVARVLVGDFVRGKTSDLRPATKSSSQSSSYYDSCVDSESNPSIFVIFEKHQIYPEYLIKYS